MQRRSYPRKTLIEAFPDWKTQGIFAFIQNPPWANDTSVTATALDLDYFGNRSGNKQIAPIVNHLLSSGVVDDVAAETLAQIIKMKFGDTWKRRWDAYHLQYQADQNYAITESGNHSKTTSLQSTKSYNSGTSGSYQGTASETVQHGKTETTAASDSRTGTSGIYGFNSQETSVPANDSSGLVNYNATVTDGGTDSTTGTESGSNSTTHTGTDGETSTGSESGTNSVVKSGIFGGASRQELISKELELWRKSFFEQVYEDVDSVLTLPIYAAEESRYFIYL